MRARRTSTTARSSIGAILFALSCFALVIPHGLAAQTVITVQSSGISVAAAEVSIWDVQGRAGLGRTDGLGAARIVLERGLAANAFVLVRRLGFAPAREPFEMRDSMSIAMTAVAAKLPVLAVRTKELRCPSTTEPEADSVWRESSRRYSMRLTQFRIDWTGYHVSETVTAEQRGYADPNEMRPPLYGTGGSIHGEAGMENPPPYAMYERHIALGGEYWQWRYANLESYSADHFLSERFREQHSLVVLGRTESTTIIGFCPRNDSQADLKGELQIGVDASLMSARWFFRVPHDDEDAGAEATFAPTMYEGREYILAIRGSFWRRSGKTIYNQRRFENVRWELHPRARSESGPSKVPRLNSREHR